MYQYSTRGRFTPENTDFVCPLFPSVRIRVDCTRAAVHHSSFVFCRARPLSPLRLRSLPHLSCVFICFIYLLCPRPHCTPLHVPSHRARVLPSVQIVCIPMAYVSAARPCALVRTVFHFPSSLPLSRDANPLVTSTCRIQLGCSGHPHTHISHSHSPVASY